MWGFVRNWALPLAMLTGALGYMVFATIPMLEPIKPTVNGLIAYLTPSLIFVQLLLTFCRVNPSSLLPRMEHLYLLVLQLVGCVLLVLFLLFCPLPEAYRWVLEGAMVCVICPTATAAAVITGRLGGSVSMITTYTLLSNLLAATIVPLLFPLVEPHPDYTFCWSFFRILYKVFPLLLFPFILAMLLRYFLPKVHRLLAQYSGAAFYLWAVALVLVTGQTVRSLVNSDADVGVEWMMALAGLLTCALQFYLGKRVGGLYNDRISAGQALGQKNTVLAIWMAYTYLYPLSSVAPGSYVLWQNLFNTWQLWQKRKKR